MGNGAELMAKLRTRKCTWQECRKIFLPQEDERFCSDDCKLSYFAHKQAQIKTYTCLNKFCEVSFESTVYASFCLACAYDKKRERFAQMDMRGASKGYGYESLFDDPYQSPDFLKTWQGRVPNPHLGY